MPERQCAVRKGATRILGWCCGLGADVNTGLDGGRMEFIII